jgi:hypothetical protein
MDCREARDLLQEELDGRLDAAAAVRLAEHVASCASCAEERRSLASLRATFRATPRPAAPADFKSGVMSALPNGRLLRLPRVLGWIAAAAAVALVGVSLFSESPLGGASAEREVAAKGRPAYRAHATETEEAEAPVDVLVPQKAMSEADADSPAAAAPAAGAKPPGEAAPPPRANEPSKFASRKKADEVAPPAVRYVVFRDAARAEQFAKDLEAGDAWKSRDKSPAPGYLGGEKRGDGGKSGGAAGTDARRASLGDVAVDLTKEAAGATRRIVKRTTIAAADVDAALAIEATRAGGSIVPRAETAKFAAVVEPPPPAAAPTPAPDSRVPDAAGAAELTAKDDERRKEKETAKSSLALPADDKNAPPRVVVVIVVLEAPR